MDEDLKYIIESDLRQIMRWYNIDTMHSAWEFINAMADEAQSYLENPYKNLSIKLSENKEFCIDGKYEPGTLDRELIEEGYTQEEIEERLFRLIMFSRCKGKWNRYISDRKTVYAKYQEQLVKELSNG